MRVHDLFECLFNLKERLVLLETIKFIYKIKIFFYFISYVAAEGVELELHLAEVLEEYLQGVVGFIFLNLITG